jgi:hypothetical protein
MRTVPWLALLLFLSTEAQAAGQRVWISEFASARVEAMAPMAFLPTLVSQPPLDLSGGLPKTSSPINASTRFIRIICEVACAFNAKGATATINDLYLPPLRPEYFGVTGVKTISIIGVP